MPKAVYMIENLDCANCAAKIEAKINALPEVEEATITFATRQLRVTAADPEALIPQMLELARSITVAVRADRPGAKFVDFQTVQGDPLMAATGKPKTTGNTILSPHAYLQDASFTVFIDTTAEWQQRIVSALENPRWCMYLGRKNCVPSRPILADRMEAADLMEALKEYPAAERAGKTMTYECEHPDSTAASIQRPDDLIGTNRQFQLRRVWRGSVERKEEQDVSD